MFWKDRKGEILLRERARTQRKRRGLRGEGKESFKTKMKRRGKKKNLSGEGEIKMKRWRNERGRGEASICGQEWFGTHYAEVWFWPGSH